MRSFLPKTAITLALAGLAYPADLTSNGSWTETITAGNLVSGAGSDLQPEIESITGVTSLSLTNAAGSWSMRARKTGGHGDVTVHVKRSSDGSGSGTISGGTAYQALTGSDSEIFTGSEDRSNITLQYKITGLSKDIPPATYVSSIIFTVQ